MKLITKLVISMLGILVVAYYGSAFVMPSITVINHSGQTIEQIEVALPSSNLNFGSILNDEKNTLHYTLKQNDGVYHYTLKLEKSTSFEGDCGDVTKNEIHKRVIITLDKNNEVNCTVE